MRLVYVFIATLVLFSVFTYAFVDKNLSYLNNLYTGLYFTNRFLLVSIYTFLISILFGCFYFLINHQKKINLKKIIFFTITVTIFAYPAALAFDIFNYITTAKVLFLYQENPYTIYPIEFKGDPYLEFTRAANKTALYGPFWIILTGIPYFLGFGNFIVILFSFKLFIVGFFASTVFLINKIDKNATLFFALNPLVIIETLVSSHNDIVMIFFALLGIYFLKSRKVLSFFSLLASIMIKFATVFLIPVFLLSLFTKFRSKYRYFAISMLVVFFVSPLREELYPWYAIWFIAFTAFLYKNKFLQNLVLVFSFGLMLRYIPYMASGNYFGPTPIIRNILMLSPVLVFLIYSWFRSLKRKNA